MQIANLFRQKQRNWPRWPHENMEFIYNFTLKGILKGQAGFPSQANEVGNWACVLRTNHKSVGAVLNYFRFTGK